LAREPLFVCLPFFRSGSGLFFVFAARVNLFFSSFFDPCAFAFSWSPPKREAQSTQELRAVKHFLLSRLPTFVGPFWPARLSSCPPSGRRNLLSTRTASTDFS